jgi:hypothetical protein
MEGVFGEFEYIGAVQKIVPQTFWAKLSYWFFLQNIE